MNRRARCRDFSPQPSHLGEGSRFLAGSVLVIVLAYIVAFVLHYCA